MDSFYYQGRRVDVSILTVADIEQMKRSIRPLGHPQPQPKPQGGAVDDFLGKKRVIKATEIRVGDFLEGDFGVSSAEVLDVQVTEKIVYVELAVKGVVRLDPTWDVAVYRKETSEPSA